MAQPWYPAGRRPEELAEEDADEALTAIRDTFARVAAAGDDAAAYFYGWLFTWRAT